MIMHDIDRYRYHDHDSRARDRDQIVRIYAYARSFYVRPDRYPRTRGRIRIHAHAHLVITQRAGYGRRHVKRRAAGPGPLRVCAAQRVELGAPAALPARADARLLATCATSHDGGPRRHCCRLAFRIRSANWLGQVRRGTKAAAIIVNVTASRAWPDPTTEGRGSARV